MIQTFFFSAFIGGLKISVLPGIERVICEVRSQNDDAARRMTGGVFRLDRNQHGVGNLAFDRPDRTMVRRFAPAIRIDGKNCPHLLFQPLLVAVQAKNSTTQPPRSDNTSCLPA
jgi:hypothetical protein